MFKLESQATLEGYELQRTKLGMLIGPILVMTWAMFDYIFEFEHFTIFFMLRIVFCLITLGLLMYINRCSFLRRHHKIMGLMLYFLVIFSILPMVLMANHFYPYMLGFTTIFFGTAIFMLWPASYILSPFLILFPFIYMYGEYIPGNEEKMFTFAFILFNIAVISGVAAWSTRKLVLKQYELSEQLHYLSLIDQLTQIPNRRLFEEKFGFEWKRSYREKQPLTLMLLDIDFFKEYNDMYGHKLGDQCLKKIVESVSTIFKRSTDFFGRYSGDEFIIFLPNTDAEGAQLVAKKIKHAIEELAIEHKDSSVAKHITLSIGIASSIPFHEDNHSILREHSDLALYAAKHKGRNQYVLFDPEM